MIRRVLVGVDGSPRAAGVFDAAAELAERFAAMISVLRVVYIPPEFPAAAAGSGADPLPAHLMQQARRELAELCARAVGRPVAMGESIVRFGVPWRVIAEVADELDVDLIVIGSHGYRGLDRLLGTTAGRVANLAHRSVLVVHERTKPSPADREGLDSPSAPPYRRIGRT